MLSVGPGDGWIDDLLISNCFPPTVESGLARYVGVDPDEDMCHVLKKHMKSRFPEVKRTIHNCKIQVSKRSEPTTQLSLSKLRLVNNKIHACRSGKSELQTLLLVRSSNIFCLNYCYVSTVEQQKQLIERQLAIEADI
jgi:hypothetical protein